MEKKTLPSSNPFGVRSVSSVPTVTAVSAAPVSYGQLPMAERGSRHHTTSRLTNSRHSDRCTIVPQERSSRTRCRLCTTAGCVHSAPTRSWRSNVIGRCRSLHRSLFDNSFCACRHCRRCKQPSSFPRGLGRAKVHGLHSDCWLRRRS